MWSVKKQDRPALSTVQAELIAFTTLCQDVEYAGDIWEFLGATFDDATVCFCDNKGAIENALHPTFSSKLRHVQNRHFYCREVVERGVVRPVWVPTALNGADLGTKALGAMLHRLFSGFVMGSPIWKDVGSKKKSFKGRFQSMGKSSHSVKTRKYKKHLAYLAVLGKEGLE